jgi:NAD+ synthase
MSVLDPIALFHDRSAAIKEYHEETGVPRAELDISGGIDSAVMACLLKEALGADKITMVHSRFSTSGDQTQRAQGLADALGIPMIDFNGEAMFSALLESMEYAIVQAHGGQIWSSIENRVASDPTILGSIRSCLRAPIGRGFNRLLGNGIRHGTGNECEDRFIRFYQKGGDGEVDTNPMAMLTKTEVYQLAFACGEVMGDDVKSALRPIIAALPSPDLWGTGDGHSDEQELLDWLGVPFTYGRVDPDTGKVLRFGTIERVARFLDSQWGACPAIETRLFIDDLSQDEMRLLVEQAVKSPCFRGCAEFTTSNDFLMLLRATRRVERITRHKSNPVIATLGTREALVSSGLLTNDLTLED